jgi:regulator of sigma E protease
MLAVSLSEPTFLEWLGDKAWIVFSIGAGLTFVIFVHELGHFLVAKACGVKCEKFYVGFDFFEFKLGPIKIPRALIKFQWGETEYGLGSLPLGGYVKMLGQDDDPRNAEAEAARIRGGDSDQARAEAIASGLAAEGLVPGKSVEEATEAAAAAAMASPHRGLGEPVPAKTVTGHTVLLDPRSYPAKSVPARMAIISAGVIMNLIFGVILGAAAYKLGVDETPAIIGATTPGGIPWKMGLEPGSKALQIGEGGSPYEFVRWDDFLFAAILNEKQEVPVLFRKPNGEKEWLNLKPTRMPGSDRPMLGLAGPKDRQVNVFPDFAPQMNAVASPPLEDYDVVIEAAGQEVTSGADLQSIFAQNPCGEITLKVERPAKEDHKKRRWEWQHEPQVVDVKLSQRPIRDLGVQMKIGPIMAIRDDSPAMRAGLKEGDVLVEIDGEPIGEPLSLTQRLTPTSSTPAELTIVVLRTGKEGKTERKSFQVTPEQPQQSHSLMWMNPVAIEPIGIAFRVTNDVASVTPGGPAEKAGLRPGDTLTLVAFEPGIDDQAQGKLASVVTPFLFEKVDLADKGSWPAVVSQLQMLPAQSSVTLTWTRNDKKMSGPAAPVDAEDFFDDARGLRLYSLEITHTAANWSEAFGLGFRETKEKLLQTALILRRLVTGQLSPTNLSGPAGIIYAAGAFASEGLPSLLMFLVLLSANLAILNFLPIPALDGGHMLFLTAEAIRGKPVDEKLQVRLTVAGVICLLSLMVFATAMDIGRFAQMIQRWFA